jgi:hypothetical protein
MVSPVSAMGKTSVLVLDRTPGYYLNGHAIGLKDFLSKTFTVK